MRDQAYKNKSDEFKAKLLEVEQKHLDYFENREPKYDRDGDRDHLHNHWVLWIDSYLVKFGFANDSELPEGIRKECLGAFDEVFG